MVLIVPPKPPGGSPARPPDFTDSAPPSQPIVPGRLAAGLLGRIPLVVACDLVANGRVEVDTDLVREPQQIDLHVGDLLGDAFVERVTGADGPRLRPVQPLEDFEQLRRFDRQRGSEVLRRMELLPVAGIGEALKPRAATRRRRAWSFAVSLEGTSPASPLAPRSSESRRDRTGTRAGPAQVSADRRSRRRNRTRRCTVCRGRRPRRGDAEDDGTSWHDITANTLATLATEARKWPCR